MDPIINSALEEICARGAQGIPLADLWSTLALTVSSDIVKSTIWTRLLALPVLRFELSGRSMDSTDPKIGSLAEAERLGVRVSAGEGIRDSFVGIDDLSAATAKISAEQRRALDRIAAARTNGITQCGLSKELGIKGNNFFYQVRNLELQQLIVRQTTVLKEKEGGPEVENGQKHNLVNTNLMHLYRYAKTVNLNSQQIIEITKPARPYSLGNADIAGKISVVGDDLHEKCGSEDKLIKDYLPAMKAVCDKLEEANDKILVIRDIKVALGYRKTRGHRDWRTIMKRLEDVGLAEKFYAEVNGKKVQCLRLLKTFDRNDFQSNPIVSTYDGLDSDNLVKPVRRGHVTDQFLELPMEYCIYDMVDAEGPKGITILEVCRRLGFTSKKMYNRITEMCSKFGMCVESEKPNKTQLYRVWTHRNYKLYSSNVSSDNCLEATTTTTTNGLSNRSGGHTSCRQSSSNVELLNPSFQADLHSEKQSMNGVKKGVELPHNCDGTVEDAQLVVCSTVPHSLTYELSLMDNDATPSTAVKTADNNVASSESLQSVSPTTFKQARWQRSVASTVLGVRREQRILKRLQDDNFILYGELYRWLKESEKDRPTKMDRGTLNRILKKFQQDGLCKINQITIPAVTNFSRTREQSVILHPSVDSISSDLLNQIYKSYRDFEFQSHSRESDKSTSHPVLTGIKMSSRCIDDQPVILEAMRANGYVQAKMVRAKLFHQFLWGYVSSLPDWQNNLPAATDDCNTKNSRQSCHFAMITAIQAMPVELFFQIVGSAKEIDEMVQRCKLGLRLMDLSDQEYKRLLDTYATGRLSRIIDILLRLKLIQLVWQGPVDIDLLPDATPTHAIELEPCIEEPLPRVSPYLKINSLDLRPRIRHDFVFSKQEDVNAYWETLEYCYAPADRESASLSFPGSAVHEVFSFRSWTSVRVMTAEQRMELLKRMEVDNLEKKIPFKQCVEIARELNLSVEQVLRVSYDKQQRRSLRPYCKSKIIDQENCVGTHLEPVHKKRRISKDRSREHAPCAATEEISCGPTISPVPCIDQHNMDKDSCVITDTNNYSNPSEAFGDDVHCNSAGESDTHDDQNLSFIKRRSHIRQRRFTWTDELDRQLIMQYARHRVIMGERSHRVAWCSVSGIPTNPHACGRRMHKLNEDKSTRMAVMRLCNLLGARYDKYLKNTRRMLGREALNLGVSEKSIEGTIVEETNDRNTHCGSEDTQASFEQSCWDDFEDLELKTAMDEILRCKKIGKIEHTKRIGSCHGQGWSDAITSEQTTFAIQEHDTPMEESLMPASHGDIDNSHVETGNNSNILSTNPQCRSSSHVSHKKFMKLSNSRRLDIQRKICESTAVANAVELLKLVFLSNSSSPEVLTSLAETLQKYSKCDLIAAFNFLKEKEFVDVGNGNRHPVLSQKFWHNACTSPFPVDSGKRAASFSAWLHEQDKNLEDGIHLNTDIQCGELFHLFAFVSSGEVSISPILPKEGVGEADEAKTLQSVPMDDEIMYLKYKSDKAEIAGSVMKDEKQKSQGKVENDFCSRREKGFPGISVCINRETLPRADVLQCPADGDHITSSTCNEMYLPDLDNFIFETQSNGALDGSLFNQMTNYAENLASTFSDQSEAFIVCPELFQSVCSAINKAGEQGMDIEEISGIIFQGVKFTEVVVDILEAFQLAVKVNAYDSVRVVSSSFSSKYYVGLHVDHNEDNIVASNKKAQQISGEQHDTVNNFESNARLSLSDGHKLTLLDLPSRPGPSQAETHLNKESVASDACDQVHAASVKKNETGETMFSAASNVYWSILPWINGDGTTNTIVYQGLTRRVLGIVMQNPGIMEEDIIRHMDVLNPQSCRRLLDTMILENHLSTRMILQTTAAAAAATAPPSLLQTLFKSDVSNGKPEFRKHFFANPLSASLL